MRKVLACLAVLAAAAPMLEAQEAHVETARERLERQAGDQWDAAHDQTRPARRRAQAAEVKALLDKVQALSTLSSFEPDNVAKTLRLPLKFEQTGRGEYYTTYEAALSSGAIRRVELRVGDDPARVIAIVDVDRDLGILPGELIDRFGEKFGVGSPSIHAPEDSPYYYVYKRRRGKLSLGIKPGPVHVFQSAVWNTVADR